ncbi:hypothetical protein V2I85_12265 [Pseudomonas viridiflava]|uniref:hypothetical protein n=1 Tax=Pseudomonas viridiflava TaxID=33069 RepID=UPI002EBAAD71|nr:hypothetical protein [Pseudomonas viridiflava]
MAPFDPAEIDDIRESLGLEDLKATEHIWYAMLALEASGVQVVLKSAEASAQLTSAELTTQILKAKYKK